MLNEIITKEEHRAPKSSESVFNRVKCSLVGAKLTNLSDIYLCSIFPSVMKFDEMSDVLVEVVKYGICSPYNWHSYRGTSVFIPCLCSSCKQIMYPLMTSVVSCIRCRSVCHRGLCMRNPTSYCPEVNRKSPIVKAPVAPTLVAKESDTVGKCDTKFFERVKLVINNVSERCSSKRDNDVDRGPSSPSTDSHDNTAQFSTAVRKRDGPIPTPGSIDCIWRQELQRIASQKSNSIKRNDVPILINFEDVNDEYTAALDLVVASVLEDATSFPGQVCSALHSLFLNLKFSCDKDILEHARECLDAIACSLLSVLPVESTPDNSHNVENIVRSVDRHVLGLSHNAMYCKAFLAAYLISAENDRKLKSRILQKREEHLSNSTIPCEHCDFVTLVLLHTSVLLSPRDKISQLRKAVQVISNSANKHTCRGIDRVFIRGDPLGVIQSTGTCQEDTDSLIEIVSNVIIASEFPLSKSAMQNKVYWFAECAYIDSMMREGDWALGIESYALTTVMQSIQSIIQ